MLYNCGRIFLYYHFSLVIYYHSGKLCAHIECRCSRSRGEDVTITDVIIKTLDRKLDWRCEWRHAWKRWAVILGYFEKSGYWRFETGRSELKFEPRRDQLGLGGAPRVVGSDGTVSIVKIVSLSLLVSKNLKAKKVIKVSYLNQESRQCFVFFGLLW